MSSVEEFESALMSLDPEAVDFPLRVDELVANAGGEFGAQLIPAIFRFFAAHPVADVGLPGTLVHFTEHFYPGYKPLLLDALEKSPSSSSILMANRILNSTLGASERKEYLDGLGVVAANTHIAPELRDEAAHFIAYQNERG